MSLTILFAFLSAYYDANQLNQGKYFKDHTSRTIFRVVVLLIISFIFNTHVLILISVFYLLFDTLLNLMRGLKWNYIGDTAIIDILFNKLGGWIPQYIFKILFTFVTIKYL